MENDSLRILLIINTVKNITLKQIYYLIYIYIFIKFNNKLLVTDLSLILFFIS